MKTKTTARIERRLIATIVAIAIHGVACSADEIGSSQAVKVTATVVRVDQGTRVVTLRDSSWKDMSFVADELISNLPQVIVGDVVTMEYTRALAIKLDKSSKTLRERTVSEGFERAASGMRPAGTATRNVSVVASVEEIDEVHRVITLRGPEATVDVEVRDLSLLSRFKKGDFVDAVYREALAFKVEPAKN